MSAKPAPRFLGDATPEQLLQAVASNHRAWFSRIARAAGGGTRTEGGIAVSYTPGPLARISMIDGRINW
jgi:hypothetical protein